MGGLCSTGVRPVKDQNVTKMEAAPGGKLTYNPYPADYDPPFPIEIIGTFSNHGIEADFTNNTIVKTNQDRGSVDWPFGGDARQALFCCLDGHGRDGDQVSAFAMESLHELIEADAQLAIDPAAALKDAFELTDENLRRSDINSHSSGTSCVSVYMLDDKLWIANAGDSRAVLGTKVRDKIVAQDLSWDQKPDCPGEMERITKLGGRVTPPEAEGLSARVWTKNGRYGLSMARSIGDHLLAKHGVIATPEVMEHEIVGEDAFLILATDGIWEFIDSQTAVDVVAKHSNATEACYELITLATKCWREEEGNYRDDITAIVIMLPAQRRHMRKHAVNVSDIVSPTSRNLRKNRSAAVTFPDGPSSDNQKQNAKEDEENMLFKEMPAQDKEKAKTFRKRRLSLNPMDDDVIEQARKQHAQELASQSKGEEEPVPPTKERKRRLSISPDMDQTGGALVPKGMA